MKNSQTQTLKRSITAAITIAALSSLPAHAGFFGHIIEHAMGYAAGGIVMHEADKAIDSRSSGDHKTYGQYAGGSGYRDDGRAEPAPASEAMPNPELTPGVANPAVTQENIDETICRPGFSRSIRPPEEYTYHIKVDAIRQYGYQDRALRHYELDHLISLEVGGDPRSPQNLWPEPHFVVGGWGSYAKDRLENKLHQMICSGQISLKEAQREEATDWVAAYKKYRLFAF